MGNITEYLKDIERHPVLSREKEEKLGKRKNQGDRKAIKLLAVANIRYVVRVAKRYQGQGVPLLNLIQQGNLGLMEAIEKFDGSKGYKVITYANSWIIQQISLAIKDNFRAKRIPVHNKQACRNREYLTRIFYTIPSLNNPIPEDEDEKTFMDIFPDNRYTSDTILSQELVFTICETLSQREADIIKKRFGLNGNGIIYTLKELGKVYNITPEGVRQIQDKALRKLREVPRIKELEYLVKS